MIVYFDTSALVATYVEDVCTKQALLAKRRAARIATSVLTYAEALGTFAAMRRARLLSRRAGDKCESEFIADWVDIQRVRLDDRLLPEVRRMVNSHPLKGADAIQLASALLVSRGCSHAGIELHFACGDRNLRRAAAAEELALAW